ncbi:hypothetical protein SPRG_07480 [Saprolegnia parasitica CBS 223.65]|uniref:Cilia- and flagella-associated protein 157 n=1 Tax=Saprolegnia parasitica (strain CBS 223.65) TaxID=695850 RepID=A0A067CL15_SAPPC|nr:hypothetical protein SPRG_07480 [Saprolegnia parasitica CBS 223.65]KDO27231.1 hypothetical protein SPRG_07480 [Saprolegnia parasitica CBS 223.65]|eukprot:XP_012202008.1 hypothetical protein SPRG_07480 [Saprolegnia parasitica CBS 223.65]
MVAPPVVAAVDTPWFVKKEFSLSPTTLLTTVSPILEAKVRPALTVDTTQSAANTLYLALSAQTRQLQRDLAAALESIKVLTAERDAAHATIRELQAANEAHVAGLTKRANDAEAKALAASADALLANMARLDLDYRLLHLQATHHERCTQLELHNAKLLRDVATLLAHRHRLEEEKDVHETVIRTLHARTSYFKARMRELETDLDTLTHLMPAVTTPVTAIAPKLTKPLPPLRILTSKVVSSMLHEAAMLYSLHRANELRKPRRCKRLSAKKPSRRLLLL